MKLVIEIDDETYKSWKEMGGLFNTSNFCLYDSIMNGTPLPKGHWTERTMHDNGFFMPNCSECGRMQPYAHHAYRYNFCPNCGADMRKAESEDKE